MQRCLYQVGVVHIVFQKENRKEKKKSLISGAFVPAFLTCRVQARSLSGVGYIAAPGESTSYITPPLVQWKEEPPGGELGNPWG